MLTENYLILIDSPSCVCQGKVAVGTNCNLYSCSVDNGWLIYLAVMLVKIGQPELSVRQQYLKPFNCVQTND